ncbi:lamin tail domain-containing protein, partial [Akkermansiaceae bacterium]|nr:lamin tail domain-containing protein [Akkermansiaceae bacterium]
RILPLSEIENTLAMNLIPRLTLVTLGVFTLAESPAEVVFSTGFEYPAGSPAVGLDAANLDGADGQIGSWSGTLPTGTNGSGSSELVTLPTTTGVNGGNQMLLADRGASSFTLEANFENNVQLADTTISFDYATRRTDGSHIKDNHIVGYDAAGNEAFHLVVSAKSFGGSDATRLGYVANGTTLWDLPTVTGADANGNLGFFNGDTGQWPKAIGSISLQLSETGFTVDFDNSQESYTTSELSYNGDASLLSRIEFSGHSTSGFWIDNILVEGTRDRLIQSFSTNPKIATLGETVTLNWELNAFDSVTLDGADISADTDINGLGSVQRTITGTQSFELSVDSAGVIETESVLVFVSPSPVLITEVVSDNDDSLESANGNSPDWIELTNFGSLEIDLGGWHLTDDSTNLLKWTFPSPTLLPAGESVIVFASNGDTHPDELHANFSLKSEGEYLALVQANGVTVNHEFAPFLPSLNEDISFGLSSNLESVGFFAQPTPGQPNGSPSQTTGPVIRELTKDPIQPAPNSAAGIPVSVEIYPVDGASVTATTLYYQIGFEAENSLPMTAGINSLWSATIPTTDLPAGRMLRWRVEASDASGKVTPFPSNIPSDGSPRYHGTVATDPSITTSLPVLHWFPEDADWYKDDGWDAAGRTGKPNNKDWGFSSIFYNGQFYDRVQMRTRGASASGWTKPKFKVELNEGDEFSWFPSNEPVDEFNLQSHFIDQYPAASSYLREPIQEEFSRDVGTPFYEMFHLELRQNSEYFGLYSFTEQIDRTFLRRVGLSDDGALYKALKGRLETGDGTATNYRKATQKDEPYTDLVGLIDSLNAPEADRADFVFDHLDLPAIINKMAIDVILYNYDRANHNYYVYHQPERDEWTYITWDTDLNLLVNSRFLDPKFNHPFYLDGNDGRSNHGLISAILNTPKSQEMYLRRLRTLMDDYLADSYLDNLMLAQDSAISADRAIDATQWGVNIVNVQSQFVNYHLPTRREQLFETWAAVIPEFAMASPAITFGSIEPNPASGNQDEEFIEILNSSSEAVDLSGWIVSGGVEFTFPPGSIIPANSNCYLSPDVRAFRLRSTTPSGGEQNFVLGSYGGHLSNFGEEVTLTDTTGMAVANITTPNSPNPNQLYLTISEIMYHPEPDGDAEFIELLNTSDSITLDLSGVQFTDGIDYIFPSGTMLAPSERIVVTRTEFLNDTALKNGGEILKLDDTDGSTIAELRYDNNLPWPVEPDSLGLSLVYIAGDPDEPSSWRASTSPGGNPESSDSVPYSGGSLLTYSFAEDPVFNLSSMTYSVQTNSGADEVILTPQWSTDLATWNDSDFIYEGPSSWRLNLSTIPPKAFLRLNMELR